VEGKGNHMSGMSRRDLLRASAGAAAVAVPMSALTAGGFAAAGGASQAGGAAAAGQDQAASVGDVQLDVSGPVMFCVRDVQSGEVSILHGMQEVVVKDRQLVNRIISAAQARRAI
jgi:hypothetical protein